MKKLINILVASSAAVLLSCTDLDVEQFSKIEMSEFLRNERELLMYAGRAYTKLQPFPEEQRLLTLMALSADEMVVAGRTDGQGWDNGRWDQIKTHNLDPSNKILRLSWEFVFQGIITCNKVLEELDRSALSFPAKDKIVSEIKVLRALYYYWAMDCWGNIPFTLDFATTALPQQKDRAFVYTYIMDELKACLPNLDEYPTPQNYGRVTKAMVYTLMAKMYLNAEVWLGETKWQEAITYCDSVINMGVFSMEANYFDNFKVNNEGSKENIFVIPYDPILTTEYFYWYMLWLSESHKQAFNLKDTPWDTFGCPPDFFKKYDAADARRKSWLFGQQYDSQGNAVVVGGKNFVINPDFTGYNPSEDGGRDKWDGARCNKYEYDLSGMQYDVYDMGNDYVLFRYADVILMKVEAVMRRDGNAAQAIDMPELKAMRTRANMPEYTVATLTMDELLAERGRELLLEGHRRQDLVRFGKYGDTRFGKPGTSLNARLFPIPQTEIEKNPNLIQNP